MVGNVCKGSPHAVAAILVAALAIFQGAPAAGAEPQKALVIRYMGDVSCAAWPRTQNFTIGDKATVLNWVLGFLSASAAERKADLLSVADQAAVSAWLDKYCGDNPSENVTQGALALRDELAAKVRVRP